MPYDPHRLKTGAFVPEIENKLYICGNPKKRPMKTASPPFHFCLHPRSRPLHAPEHFGPRPDVGGRETDAWILFFRTPAQVTPVLRLSRHDTAAKPDAQYFSSIFHRIRNIHLCHVCIFCTTLCHFFSLNCTYPKKQTYETFLSLHLRTDLIHADRMRPRHRAFWHGSG